MLKLYLSCRQDRLPPLHFFVFKMVSRERKVELLEKLDTFLKTYSKIFIVSADNVGAKQIQYVRKALYGKAEMLFGKNTMRRMLLKKLSGEYPKLAGLIPYMVNNCTLVFTNADVSEIRDVMDEQRIGAPARAGQIAPVDVWVPAGPTKLDPQQTSFFQALNISTKINKGTIQINLDVQVCFKGERVGSSQAVLLQKLDMMPFSYGFEPIAIYDNGDIFSADVLSITDGMVQTYVQQAIKSIEALSLAVDVTTFASVPQVVASTFKSLLETSLAAEYEFDGPLSNAQMLKYLADPEAFTFSAAPAAAAASSGTAAAATEDPDSESGSESDSDMGMGLFG